MEQAVKTMWGIDSTHSEVGFKVKHMMISTVKGYFKDFNVEVTSDNDDFSDAEIKVEIQVDSITTNNADRDNHLKSPDFFNAEEFPTITFKSHSFDGSTLTGELEIRGNKKEVQLEVDYNGTAVDPYGNTKAGFEISGEINRKDFGLEWNAVTEAGNIVVSDKIKLAIDAQLIKQ